MASPDSNKNNPQFVEYYQTLADIIGIFWQWHKQRIQSGNIELTLQLDESQKYISFDPQLFGEAYAKEEKPCNIIDILSDEIYMTLSQSFLQFRDRIGYQDRERLDDVQLHKQFPQPDKDSKDDAYSDAYVRDLFVKARDLGKSLDKKPEEFSLSKIVLNGMGTGPDIATMLRAINGEAYQIAPTLVSKIRIDSLPAVKADLGIRRKPEYSATPPYSLLNDSPQGVDTAKLRELGRGYTLGCPGAMKVSETTELFLRTTCGIRGEIQPMVMEFSSMVGREFDRYLDNWYRELSAENRVRYIDTETRRILDGDVRRKINNRAECPFGAGKERR